MSVNHKEWRVVKVLKYQHCYLLKAKIVLLPIEFNVFNMFSSSKLHWNKLHSEKICETSCGKVAYSVVSVCLSTGKGSIVTITNDAMDLTTTQSARHVISLHGDAPRCWHLMISEARRVGKRAVPILLECFLAETIFMRAFVFQTWSSTTIKDSNVVTVISV